MRRFNKKAQEELKKIVIGVVLLVVLIIIVKNYVSKPASGVFDCASIQGTTCQFAQCPPGYSDVAHLKCANQKENACCLAERNQTEQEAWANV